MTIQPPRMTGFTGWARHSAAVGAIPLAHAHGISAKLILKVTKRTARTVNLLPIFCPLRMTRHGLMAACAPIILYAAVARNKTVNAAVPCKLKGCGRMELLKRVYQPRAEGPRGGSFADTPTPIR